MKVLLYICFSCFLFINSACQNKNIKNTTFELMQTQEIIHNVAIDGPPVIIYKTRKNYNTNVPVIMNKEKNKIISYPSPKDIYYEGKLSYPTPLINNYLLDNRGINRHVAFLSYTYEEYSQLQKVPSLNELKEKIIDNNPLIELWECGVRSQYQDEESELNELIKNNFSGCIRKQ